MRSWIALIALAGSALAACGASDPDRELRALVAAAEAAAEQRDTSFFRDAISADYVDRRGRRRDDVIDLLRAYFLVNSTIEVVNRLETVEILGGDAASVVMQTAVIGRARGRSALGVDGELYRLELELVKDGDQWRVIGADWDRMLR